MTPRVAPGLARDCSSRTAQTSGFGRRSCTHTCKKCACYLGPLRRTSSRMPGQVSQAAPGPKPQERNEELAWAVRRREGHSRTLQGGFLLLSVLPQDIPGNTVDTQEGRGHTAAGWAHHLPTSGPPTLRGSQS